MENADIKFGVTDYPIRTSTKLTFFKNDTIIGSCSGMMVSNNMVLTSAHALYQYNHQTWNFDYILASPAYNYGTTQPAIISSMSSKVYIFKTFYNKTKFDDIALLQLSEPIGAQIGYTGIAFSADTSYFTNKVFHKFSYPSVTSPL